MSAVVYGASDDLIEVGGDVREEFTADSSENFVAFSNGAVVWIRQDMHETWRISVVRRPGLVEVIPARGENSGNDEDGCPGYSDKAVIETGVEWVLCAPGSGWAVAR